MHISDAKVPSLAASKGLDVICSPCTAALPKVPREGRAGKGSNRVWQAQLTPRDLQSAI